MTMPSLDRSSGLIMLSRGCWAVFAAMVLGALACGSPDPPLLTVGDEAVARLIADEPTHLLDPGRLSLAELDRALGRPWKVALADDLRNAVLLPPGTDFERRLRVVGDSEVRAWVGVPEGVNRPVVVRCLLREPNRRPRLLDERRVGPGADRGDRWWPMRADLGPWLGREVSLVFTASAEPDFDRSLGTPVLAEPVVVATGVGRDDRPNVVLISIDTLRADHLSLYGYPLPTSPRIDAWAATDATVFESVVAPSPWTLPSHVSLFTGLDAVHHGINHDVGGLGAAGGGDAVLALDFLAEILARSGYETAAFTGGAFLHPRYGFAQGFDRYLSWPDRARDRLEFEVGIDGALEWMSQDRARPFFVFLHTYAVHDPYRARRGFFRRVATTGAERPAGRVAVATLESGPAHGFKQRNRFVWRPRGGGQEPLVLDRADRSRLAAMYDSGIAYMDDQIGRLLDGMDDLGVVERTVVVLTSDHGESLGEAGRAGHIYLSDDNLMVPLVIADPRGTGAGRRVARQVRLIDIAPTILELVGVELPATMQGVSLAPLMAGGEAQVPTEAWSYAAASNHGLALRLDGRLKFTLDTTAWPPATGARELYELASDPSESLDLSAVDDRVEGLEAAAEAYLESVAPGLRLRVTTGDRRLRGRLVGGMIRPGGTKVIGMDGPFLAWVTMGEATLDAPPGSDFTILFEKVFGRELVFDGRIEVAGRDLHVRHRFEVAQLEGRAALVVEDGRWRSVDREITGDETSLAVEWRGGAGLAGPPAAVDDEELAEQLRALGYLD